MDIITHTLSGIAVATLIVNTGEHTWKKTGALIGLGALGGAFPDVDVISLWGGFDHTIGHWFNLSESGRVIYNGRHWYSHHGFFHSLLAAMLFTFFIGVIIWLRQLQNNSGTTLRQLHNTCGSYCLVFFLAYNIHLFEDMLTPAAAWGGVAYWWPGGSYVGGWGYIWWWNNYDLFLIVVSIILVNILIKLFAQYRTSRLYLSAVFFMLACVTSVYQVMQRQISYNYSGSVEYHELEKHSINEQEHLLGVPISDAMQKLDNNIPFYF